MIGAVGEILGAGGVIATLGYLARQVRQSNVAARHEAKREMLDLNHGFLSELARSPQVACLFRRGLEDDPELSPDEVMQLRALFLQITLTWKRIFVFEGDSVLGEAFVIEERARREKVGTPGYRKWFAQRRDWMDEAFRAQLEKEIAEIPGYAPEWPRISAGDTADGPRYR